MTTPSSDQTAATRFAEIAAAVEYDNGAAVQMARYSHEDVRWLVAKVRSEKAAAAEVNDAMRRLADPKSSERYWRDRIADEIAAIPRMATNPGMEPEDYAESAGHNVALLIAERAARRPS